MRLKFRKRNRWLGYDYSSNGCYFVTLCTLKKEQFFGKIQGGKSKLTEIGEFSEKCFKRIPTIYRNVFVDDFVIMPNHIHGIVTIEGELPNAVTEHCSITMNNRCGMLLSQIIKSYKNVVTKHAHEIGIWNFQWQRSFHDRVIRSDKELEKTREYVDNNPLNWKFDDYY